MTSDPNRSIYLRLQIMISHINSDGQWTEYVLMCCCCQQIINRWSVFHLSEALTPRWPVTLQRSYIMSLFPGAGGTVMYTVSSQDTGSQESLPISLYSPICLQSQDDSLIRQTVTLRGTHEYPITDVHIFKTATWPFPA